MSDDNLRDYVTDELLWEPSIDPDEIAVAADDGTITLRGSVGSLREKFEAASAAKRVYGVKKVHNELEVRIMGGERRDDADLRGAVLQALMLDSLVPSSIDAKAEHGTVTLTGTADHQFQRDEAELVASNVSGVTSVDDQIALERSTTTPADVRERIKLALERNARFESDDLSIASDDGTVTLSGTVGSWADHDAALAAAWAAPGVSTVEDHLLVEY
jgi:osmotically-inducible protein OsmY